MEDIIKKVVKFDNVFENFVKEIAYVPVNLKQVKEYTKNVGDLWEDFSCEYLRKIHNMQVYKLKEVPSDVLKHLKMKRQDVGIDLIAIEDDKYIAIQCKYRKTFKALSWRDVATFDALCMRTGPWHKCIIITTSHNIKREGVTLDKDIFWGKKYFSNLSKYDWMTLGNFGQGNTCGGHVDKNVNEARVRYFDK